MERKWYNIRCDCDSNWGEYDFDDASCGVRWDTCPTCGFYAWVSISENDMMKDLQDMNE